MALEWLRTWLYAIVPSTAEKNVQELSLPYDSDNDDDTDSVATLETAFEQHDNTHSFPENDTTPSNTDFFRHDRGIDTDHNPIIIQGNRWPQLIEKYGTNPGSTIILGKIEVFDLHLSFRSPFLYAYRKRVQEFSGAEIAIYDNPPRPFEASLRLTGTVENAFYAIQAYNAILDTTTIPNRKVWVTLTLKGPRMIATAEALKQRLGHILPEDGFIPGDKLHVTIGLVDPKPHRLTHKQLYGLLQSLVNGLNNTGMNKTVVGYFNHVRACQPTRLSMVPTSDRDPISVVARALRKAIEDYGFGVNFTHRPHMTVYHSTTVSPETRFSLETLRTLDSVPDFGPLEIQSVVVSDAVQTLSGKESRLVNTTFYAVLN